MGGVSGWTGSFLLWRLNRRIGWLRLQAQSLLWADLSPEKLTELKELGSGSEYNAYGSEAQRSTACTAQA